jgi:hypothetical protein
LSKPAAPQISAPVQTEKMHPRPGCLTLYPAENVLIVHHGFLSMSAWHMQNVELGRVR